MQFNLVIIFQTIKITKGSFAIINLFCPNNFRISGTLPDDFAIEKHLNLGNKLFSICLAS